MPHVLNMSVLAAGGEDPNQLIWVIAVIVMSVIGVIAGKIKERSQKRPTGQGRRPPPVEQGEPDDEEETIILPRPVPPRPREQSSRPMPQVPRGPRTGGDRPIGIPKPTRPSPLPQVPRPLPSSQSPRPMPVPAPIPRRPVNRPVARPPEPRPVRAVEPAVAARADRVRPLGEPSLARPEADVSTPTRKPAGLRRTAFTPARLREAVILREVLGPPLALREDQPL